MASHGWRTNRPLTRELREDCAGFDFYQLVRLLLHERGAGGDPLGAALDAQLCFRANLEQGFPGQEVRNVSEPGGSAGRLRIETGNYALAGYLGPLPEALVEQMLARMRAGSHAMPRFLDLFNHRLNALRYQLKAAPRLGLNLLRPERTELAAMLAALMGMAAPGLAEQMPLPRRVWLGLAGLLADPRRSAPALTRVVARFIGAPVELESLLGAWRDRCDEDATRLGRACHGLGSQTRLGRQAWLPTARIRLTLGPLDYTRYCCLLPKSRSNSSDVHPQLCGLLRFLLERRQDCWIRLRLAPGQAPAATLTARERRLDPACGIYYGLRLGQTAWLAGPTDGERTAEFLVPAYGET
ncbi:type VI secretion system baseplate subunit TssG [Chitinimonas arctica]|uniref:Type VI secretion system baseplate subunit TssG n=1 Tax=Chitinimonas arctica TaxID=2594795 RepID=A0A516SK18_9NEIS|nr:type VI secretion system baseplate subunit TssG [Chitinimonas arctica]QDQ28502.1 type VI secretion system baseplate subunit TssG [Chitinimonas arctica]